MPTKQEKESAPGAEIRSHEWDGIQEMDNPLPRWWLYVFYATVAFSIIYYVLYPAIPWGTGHTPGVLGHTERKALEQSLAAARAEQVEYRNKIDAASPAEIRDDPALLNFALAGGKSVFADNCAPCHGAGGAGRSGGYPSLADDAWLWGGTLAAIETTLRHGIRWPQDEATRVSEMPRYGADALLAPAQIADVTQHVLSLRNAASDAAAAERGAALFAEQCAACHGAAGEGNQELGAPRLSDAIWLYGDTPATIVAQIANPKHGVMPAWQGRLDETTIKMLTVYVHSLGGGQ